jgi:hypothetical protein
MVYDEVVGHILGEFDPGGPTEHFGRVHKGMSPRDPLEEMLVTQMVLAHARVLRLTQLAAKQNTVEGLRTTHEYADRASNTYRRLMLAFAEYRRPPRTGDTFAVVKQANIAGQQVIQNHENSTTNATNEQGSKPAPHYPVDAQGTPASPPALPTDIGGVGFPSCIRPAREALGAVHRPPNAHRQGQIATERDEAR